MFRSKNKRPFSVGLYSSLDKPGITLLCTDTAVQFSSVWKICSMHNLWPKQ